jgi:Na+/phosphate symporter
MTSSQREVIEMLGTTRQMFLIACDALHDELTEGVWNQLARMDREVNRQQMQVRKDVFSHLALARNRELLTGLQLLSAVVDVERVGDYTKNIGELAKSNPGVSNFGEYDERVRDLERDVRELFDLTLAAFGESDADSSLEVMERFRAFNAQCDRSIMEMLVDAPDEGVDRSSLALILLLRYLKRVGAHLKNAASVMVNPYHRIGYDAMMRGGTSRD